MIQIYYGNGRDRPTCIGNYMIQILNSISEALAEAAWALLTFCPSKFFCRGEKNVMCNRGKMSGMMCITYVAHGKRVL
jgi:hypothetical protein